MYFSEWLQEKPGRPAEVAQHFQVTPQAVSQWAAQGVPVDRLLEMRDFTKRRVTVEEMVRERAENKARAAAA